MSSNPFTRRRLLGGSLAIGGGLALSACGGGGGGEAPAPAAEQVGQAQIDEAMNKETTLTFWTWVPKIQNQVDMFQKQYPKVKVKLVNVGQGAPHYTKLRAAIKSGQGAPDVAQMEFQYIDSFTLGGDLADMAPNGASAVMNQFPDWVKTQVTKEGKIYGIPQDIGPLGLLYRDDLLKGAGLQPPKTWQEFATAAEKYHAENPKSVLTNFAPNDAGHFVAFLWQAGARPFAFDGKETVKVDLASDRAKEVAQYWNDLIKKNLVSVDPDFTDTWYQGFSNGKYASWPAAAWGPVFLQGTAAKTSGKWRATQIPQWDAANPTSGNWGGSTDAVLKSSPNQIAATQLALFINTGPSALRLATEQFLFPASNEILADPKFSSQEAPFYGGQKVNQTFADISKTVTPDFGWLPFTDFAYTAYGDTLGKAIAAKSDLVTGLQAWQDACAKYAKDQGFTVS
ncbi:MAG TPA: extracellular solute-binding protein [Propionibacteriaceae bacterium]